MSEGLEIEGSHEEQFAIVKAAVRRHEKDLYGNGQPGIMDFVSATKGQYRLIIGFLAFITALVAVLGFLIGNREYHSGILPLQSSQSQPETASHHISTNDFQYTLAERTTK